MIARVARRTMIVLAAMMLYSMFGCAAATQSGLEVGENRPPSVRIENQTPHDLIIYEWGSGVRLGRITALQSGCVRPRSIGDGSVTLYAQRSVRGGMQTYAPPIDLHSARWWTWTVKTSDRDMAIAMRPGAACGRFQ